MYSETRSSKRFELKSIYELEKLEHEVIMSKIGYLKQTVLETFYFNSEYSKIYIILILLEDRILLLRYFSARPISFQMTPQSLNLVACDLDCRQKTVTTRFYQGCLHSSYSHHQNKLHSLPHLRHHHLRYLLHLPLVSLLYDGS